MEAGKGQVCQGAEQRPSIQSFEFASQGACRMELTSLAHNKRAFFSTNVFCV